MTVVSIAEFAGISAYLGLTAFISFLAIISVSLGVLNLMPVGASVFVIPTKYAVPSSPMTVAPPASSAYV